MTRRLARRLAAGAALSALWLGAAGCGPKEPENPNLPQVGTPPPPPGGMQKKGYDKSKAAPKAP